MEERKSGTPDKKEALKDIAQFRQLVCDFIMEKAKDIAAPATGFTLIDIGCSLIYRCAPSKEAADKLIKETMALSCVWDDKEKPKEKE